MELGLISNVHMVGVAGNEGRAAYPLCTSAVGLFSAVFSSKSFFGSGREPSHGSTSITSSINSSINSITSSITSSINSITSSINSSINSGSINSSFINSSINSSIISSRIYAINSINSSITSNGRDLLQFLG